MERVPLKRTAKASLTVLQREPQESWEQPRNDLLPPRRLVEFWLAMTGLYNHKWVSACGELPINDDGSYTMTGSLWAQGLFGFTQAQIDDALRACMNRADNWPPALSEFRALCLGIPTLEVVKADIGRRKHGFTRLVWQHLDHWMFTRADQRDAERQLRAAYDFARERRMCGDDYPSEPLQLTQDEQPKYVPPTPEERMKQILKAQEAAGL